MKRRIGSSLVLVWFCVLTGVATTSSSETFRLGIPYTFACYLISALKFAHLIQSRTAQVQASYLIRKAAVDTKRRVYITSDALDLVDLLQLLHVFTIEGDELLVLVDARWGDGLCEDRGVASDFTKLEIALDRAALGQTYGDS